jgi:hypothetical protein
MTSRREPAVKRVLERIPAMTTAGGDVMTTPFVQAKSGTTAVFILTCRGDCPGQGGSLRVRSARKVETEVDSMRREMVVLTVVGALLLLAAVPVGAAAAKYKVTHKTGRVAGRVVPGPAPDQADRIGVVYDVGRFRGAVYSRQTSSGYVGWPVSNGSSYIAWVTKAGGKRFLVKKVPWAAAVGRATKMSTGTWLAQKKVHGRWVTTGKIQKGCLGRWAAGAAMLLLW